MQEFNDIKGMVYDEIENISRQGKLASGYMSNGGYSQRGNIRGGNSYRSNKSYGYGRRNYGGYSRDGAHDHMISQLHQIMNEAQNDEDRQAVQRLIDQMSNN